MSSREENVALVRSGLEALSRGDLQAAITNLDPEVELHTPPEMANAGTYHGLDEYRIWMGNWMEARQEFEISIARIEPVGERHVLVELDQRRVGRGSGVEVERPVTQMSEIRDGKAMRFHLYGDWETAMAAVAEGDKR
jgi:limonene-1,2-epoxide hydrolase